jgi:hypothetical protein
MASGHRGGEGRDLRGLPAASVTLQKNKPADVRYGSLADIAACPADDHPGCARHRN